MIHHEKEDSRDFRSLSRPSGHLPPTLYYKATHTCAVFGVTETNFRVRTLGYSKFTLVPIAAFIFIHKLFYKSHSSPHYALFPGMRLDGGGTPSRLLRT